MSTKSSIAYNESGHDWHLYEETEDESVGLEMVGVSFSASPNRVVVELPPYILDAIAEAHARKEFPHQQDRSDWEVSE